MVDVSADEVDDGLHRVVVGLEVEVKGAADDVFRAVGEVELHRGGHALAVHLDEHAVNLMFLVDNQAVAHAVGLLQVLDDHGVNILQILAQVAIYGLVCHVDGTFELWHLDVDPVFFVWRIDVGGDDGIVGAFEAVFLDGVDLGVGFFRQVDAEIAARFGQVVVAVVAGNGDGDEGEDSEYYGKLVMHSFVFCCRPFDRLRDLGFKLVLCP